MKNIFEISNKIIDKNKIKGDISYIYEDKDVIKFIKKYNLTDEAVQDNIQVFYDFCKMKKLKKIIKYNARLSYDKGRVYLNLVETKETIRLRNEQKLSNRVKTSYCPKSLLNSKFTSVYNDKQRVELTKRLIVLCDKIINKQPVKGMYIYGATGIGKSYLMGCVYNYLKEKGEEPAIIYFPEFVRKMKSNIHNGEYNVIIDEIRDQKILIIDDIGSENMTEFVRDEILNPIISHRAAEGLITFFTSNFSVLDLKTTLETTKTTMDETKAMRILDRIAYLTELVYFESVNERMYN